MSTELDKQYQLQQNTSYFHTIKKPLISLSFSEKTTPKRGLILNGFSKFCQVFLHHSLPCYSTVFRFWYSPQQTVFQDYTSSYLLSSSAAIPSPHSLRWSPSGFWWLPPCPTCGTVRNAQSDHKLSIFHVWCLTCVWTISASYLLLIRHNHLCGYSCTKCNIKHS